MNEEEKEAIEDLEEMIELYEDDCLLTTEDDIKYIKVILNLIEKQQKEIEERLKEIDNLYKMMSAKDDQIEELNYFKEEVSNIIKDAYYTAEPTYCKIKKLLGE